MNLKCDSTWLLQLRGAQIGRPWGPITLPLDVQPDHSGASWSYSVFCSRECCVLSVSSISIMDPSDLMRVFMFLRCPGRQVVGNWSCPVASLQKLNRYKRKQQQPSPFGLHAKHHANYVAYTVFNPHPLVLCCHSHLQTRKPGSAK